MHWFQGTIPEAVSLSKKKNAIFVVFVEGDNELSVEMSSTIDDAVVLKKLSDDERFLAVKLKSGSVDYTHFAQLYQFVPVPSLFFIGHNGTPLEVVCAGVQPGDLANRINRILEQHLKDKSTPAQPQTMQPSTSSQAMRQATAELIHSEAANVQVQGGKHREETESPLQPAQKIQKTEHNEAVKNADPKQNADNQEYEVVCDGDVCVRKPKVKEPSDSGPSSSSNEVPPNKVVQNTVLESQGDINARVEAAKKLLEARQREKEEQKKEEEKRKELERRATGQGVAELKRWQEDEAMKHIQEERKREKLENNLARQRILAQIAQDRAERKARDAPQPEPEVADNPPVNVNTTTGDGNQRAARIQFKLPDGASHTAHFQADGTLAEVHRYLADNLQLSQSNFSLWTAFPRRELTDADATLRGLQLTPSAALLVLPRRVANTVSRPSGFSNLVTFLTQFFTSFVLQPTMDVVEWVRSRVFPRPPSAPSPINPAVRPNARPPQRTNVHRLHGDRGSDDENNTWNGNSTQQM